MLPSLIANAESVSASAALARSDRVTPLTTTTTGFTITAEALANAVAEYVGSPAVSGWAGMGAAITALKNTSALRWVNPLELKNAVESALTNRFGAKEAARPKGKVRSGNLSLWLTRAI